MDEQFVRDRITQLRLRKGVSEYKMSYELGHSRGYVLGQSYAAYEGILCNLRIFWPHPTAVFR